MTALTRSLLVALPVSLLVAGAWAADDAALKKDMTSVIALQGQPCGEVIAVKVNSDNDYACTCKDGNRYHVYINTAGRVVVEKQK